MVQEAAHVKSVWFHSYHTKLYTVSQERLTLQFSTVKNLFRLNFAPSTKFHCNMLWKILQIAKYDIFETSCNWWNSATIACINERILSNYFDFFRRYLFRFRTHATPVFRRRVRLSRNTLIPLWRRRFEDEMAAANRRSTDQR